MKKIRDKMNETANKPGFLLLHTFHGHLKVWFDVGFIDRELRYYRIMREEGLGKMFMMTYGRNEDRIYNQDVWPFKVLPKRFTGSNLRYSILVPLIHWSSFKSSHIIKSNQSRGAWVGLIAKILMPSKKVVLRCGYVRTREMMMKEEKLFGSALARSILVEKLGFRFADVIIVTSRPDKHYIERTYRVPAHKVKIIPNSVDTDIFVPPDVKQFFKKKNRIIGIGRLVKQKNFHSVITAASMLDKKVEITIIGSGIYRDTLKAIAESGGVDVTFLSSVDNNEIPGHLQKADIFIMPQLYGSGMSKVIIEAMACGLITIGSNIQAHRETLEDGVNGFLCETDPHSIRNCLERITALDPSELKRISTRARKDVVEKYSMRGNARKEFKIYRELLDGTFH